MDLNGVICRGDEDEEVVEIRGGQSISIGNPSFPVLAPRIFQKDLSSFRLYGNQL